MSDDLEALPDMEGDRFAWFSNEYAQALQALRAIENQSSTLLLLGVSDELLRFLEQFVAMATRAKALAEDFDEPHFAEWFGELLEKAAVMRGELQRVPED